MTIRNDKIKNGADYLNGEVLYDYDLDDTNNAIIEFAGAGMAENAYRILQANNVYTNGDHFVVDEFTDATGTKNTVNTGSTNCAYVGASDHYALFGATGTTEIAEVDGASLVSSNNFTITGTIDSSSGYFDKVKFITLSSGTVTHTITIKKGSTTIATNDLVTSSTGIKEITFIRSDYSEILEDGDTWSIVITTTGHIYKNSVSTNHSGSYFDYTSQVCPYLASSPIDWLYFAEYIEQSSPGVVVCDTNTKTLDGTEGSVCIYADQVNTANTSITVNISDGTTTLTGKALNEVHALTGFSSGTLELTFNLITTDTSETPELTGYGVYIK